MEFLIENSVVILGCILFIIIIFLVVFIFGRDKGPKGPVKQPEQENNVKYNSKLEEGKKDSYWKD